MHIMAIATITDGSLVYLDNWLCPIDMMHSMEYDRMCFSRRNDHAITRWIDGVNDRDETPSASLLQC